MVDKKTLFARTEPMKPGPASGIIWLLTLFIICFAVWASWAEIDEQIRTEGQVIASSRSQVIQTVDGGVLSKLFVREGDTVERGDLLAELDRTRFAARQAETEATVRNLTAKIERLSAELADRPLNFPELVRADDGLVRAQTNLYERRRELQREQRSSLRASLAIAREELEALEDLASTGDAAQSELLQSRRQVNELEGKITNNRNEYRSKAQTQLTEARGKLDEARQVLEQRQDELDATNVYSPMAGKIKDLKVTTMGAVLESGDEIMQIVPTDDPLIVEARVDSADVAFVRPDLPANVKLDAYDFTIYGSMQGKVTYVSPDTISEDLKRDEEPYYRVLIKITHIPERANIDPIEIIPGMTVLAEIITGERTVAQYMLKPLRRGSAAAMTER